MKHVPAECQFSDRGAGECWGCPAIFCKHARAPFADQVETDVVVLRAAEMVKAGRVRGYRTGDSLIQVAVDLKLALMAAMPLFRHIQATEAVVLGFASPDQAARWAGLGTRKFREHLSRTKT